jgi:hexosaminidase
MHKLNRLHLHLTDSNAWRVEIKKYPELTAKGSGGKFYSQKELRDIVQYAAKLHIVVIPEIESPGHSGAALSVHPEWRTGHAVNLQEKTIVAFHTIFKEVMDIFPSEYIHVGGDEVGASWLNNEADLQVIEKQGLAKNNLAIQEWLQGQLIEPILAARRRPAMWFMKESWNIGESPLSKDTLVLGWFGREESMKAVEAGYDVVMAPMDGTYFDYRTQRDSPVSGIGINTLDNVYNYDPLPAKLANDKTTKRILGVQGQLWGADFKEPREVENHGFPRTCALAEVAWTARSQKNYKQFIKRMEKQYHRLEFLGVNYYKLKTPMTVVATESVTVKRGATQSFEWPLSSYLNKGAGEYEMMFHVPDYYHSIEASHVQLICNGKVLVAPDWVGDTTKRGGKINGLFRIKLPHYDPTASYVLKAEVKNLSRRGDCAFEFCLRKKTR